MVDHLDPSSHVHDLPRRFISATKAAVAADVSRFTIIRWCRDGVLDGHKVVGRWRVDPGALDRLLTGGTPD